MQVFAIGEALIDFLSNNSSKNDKLGIGTFQPFAGGAPANVAVAVAKLGGHSSLIGKVGYDRFGTFLIESLKKNHVCIDYVSVSPTRKTALAFISLDEYGEREFEFFDEQAAHKDLGIEDYPDNIFAQASIVTFCSGLLTSQKLQEGGLNAIERFRAQRSIVHFDINYRPSFWHETNNAPSTIDTVIGQVDIVKASQEEMISLYGAENIELKVKEWLSAGVALVLITNGKNAIAFYTVYFNGTYPVPDVTAIDTTAAGDAFVGGFLYKLSTLVKDKETFISWLNNFENVLEVIDFAGKCGAHAVTKLGAFDALPSNHDISQ